MLSNVITMPIIALLCLPVRAKTVLPLFRRAFHVLFHALRACLGPALDGRFRVLQGIGGGALIPLAQAILRETFPPKNRRTAMGIYGLGVILAPAFAPTLGGWLTDNYSWPWIFYINVPVGILNILLIMRFIEDPPYLVREKGKIDFSGLFLMSVGLGALQIMLEKGDQKDWFTSHLITYLAVAACLGLVLFVVRELTTDRAGRQPADPEGHQFQLGQLPERHPQHGSLLKPVYPAPLPAAAPRLSCLGLGPGAHAEEPRHGRHHAAHGQGSTTGRDRSS